MALTLTTRRDPFAEFDAMIRRAFPVGPAGTLAGKMATSGQRSGFAPAAQVRRDGDDAVVRLELPGVDIDNDVTVELDGSRLVVRGERRDEHTDEGDGRLLQEFRYGSFRRSFTLPEHVAAEALSASYDAGVLTVRVAGAYAGTEPRRITVTAGAPAAAVETAETVESAGTAVADGADTVEG